jgi:hypothetical protein
MTPRNDAPTLAHCRTCGWRRDDGAVCARCGERFLLSGVTAGGEVVAATAIGGVAFTAVSLGDAITALAIGGEARPGQHVALTPRDDGTLALEVLA